MKFPKDDLAELNEFYGRLDIGVDGFPSRRWENSNLCTSELPFAMCLAWRPEVVIRRVAVNKLLRGSLFGCLERIKNIIGIDEIRKIGLDQWGGCYCFRPQRRSHRLSVHCWGAAVDLNPMRNNPGTAGNMPDEVVKIFEDEGWEWGGRWKNKDPMHFQAASTK